MSALEIIEQSLCFGWIDSVRYPYGEGFAQRITPRRRRSVWSNVNTARYQDLLRRGLVHPSGRTVFDTRDLTRSGIYSFENRDRGLDDAQVAKFKRHKAAWRFFESQPPSYRRVAAYWVVSAKRDETRARRLAALIEHSAKAERMPAFTPRPLARRASR